MATAIKELRRYGREAESHWDAEKYYEMTGFRLSGPTALGMAWKYNELKPRLFYILGLDESASSLLIQPIFNIILDEFANVHRLYRHRGYQMKIDPGDLVRIYDYSAFTSTLDEIKEFTRQLAKFYRGTIIKYVDSHFGVVDADLGELLEQYTEECNSFAEIDAAKVLEMEDYVIFHTGGKLGVPGNISSSTLLHGIHLALVIGSFMKNKVVGDDAIGAFPASLTDEHCFAFLRQLGTISRAKSEAFPRVEKDNEVEDRTWNYVKRKITRIGDRLIFGELTTWPNLAMILDLRDEFHTVPPMSKVERLKVYAGQLSRFYEEVKETARSEKDITIVQSLVQGFHAIMGIRMSGATKIRDGARVPPAFIDKEKTAWQTWQDEHWTEADEFPEISTGSELVDENFYSVGSQLVVPMGSLWKLLGGLGYIEATPKNVLVRVSDEYVTKLLSGTFRYKTLYDISVVQSIPFRFHELVKAEYYYVPSDSLADTVETDNAWNEIRDVGYYTDDDSSNESE